MVLTEVWTEWQMAPEATAADASTPLEVLDVTAPSPNESRLESTPALVSAPASLNVESPPS